MSARGDEIRHRRRLASSSTAYVPSATSAKYALTLLVGLVVGVVAWAIEGATDGLVAAQAGALVSRYYGRRRQPAALFAYVVGVGARRGVGRDVSAPLASGGGVTAVMATLNGNDVPGTVEPDGHGGENRRRSGRSGSALAVGRRDRWCR